MNFKQFTLDPFQEEAIHAIEQNNSVVVSAPTGSGKTLIADYIIEKHKDDPRRIIYTAPIKALSNQKYKDFCTEYGKETIGLMTGDIVINPAAKVVIMTTEIYRNMAISRDEELRDIAYVIFDEIHYINDVERGYVWEESIIYSAEAVRFLCLSATIPNADEFSRWIQAIKHHPVKTIVATKRNVPLQHLFYDYELGIAPLEEIKTTIEDPEFRASRKKHKGKQRLYIPEPSHIELIKELKADKLPCFFFSFSRRDCQEKAKELAKANLFQREGNLLSILNQKLKSAPVDINRLASTRILKESISQGIAFHHAGLLPIVKNAIEEMFGEGLIKVLYTTETFAVGINMPAKTVCFTSLRKFDGRNFRNLTTMEYFQIAGRAGRRGIDSIGYAISMIFRPTFRHQEAKSIVSGESEPIQSQFRLSVNTVLNLIHQHPPEEIEKRLRMSFFSYQKFGNNFDKIPTKLLLARYFSIVRKLRKLGYMENNSLTWKGVFASKIYADEITIGEIFATGMVQQLDEYQILLAIAAIVYEGKERIQFRQEFKNERLANLKKILQQNEYLYHERKFLQLEKMTAMIHPLYHGKGFFDLLNNTTMLEGDLIRFFSQILDRLGQIKKATDDEYVVHKTLICKGIIEKALEGIYLVG